MDVQLEPTIDHGASEDVETEENQITIESEEPDHTVDISSNPQIFQDASGVQYVKADESGGLYRVVTVTQSTETTPVYSQSAVIQAQSGSGSEQNGTKVYLPAAANSSTAMAGSGDVDSANAIHQAVPFGGGFYLFTTPEGLSSGGQQQVSSAERGSGSGGGRNIAPRTVYSVRERHNGPGGGGRPPRDEKRRATHNEVERRRRDKINNWIEQLGKLIPPNMHTSNELNKTSSTISPSQSKGGVLSAACRYIEELSTNNASLTHSLKEAESIMMENDVLRQKNDRLQQDLARLKASIQQQQQGRRT